MRSHSTETESLVIQNVADPTEVSPFGKIVILKKSADVASVKKRLHHYSVTVHKTYVHIKGFHISLPEQASDKALQTLLSDPNIEFVEDDQVATLFGVKGKPTKGTTLEGQQTPWGITRVGGFSSGTAKTIWVIDTGVDLDHPDLIVDLSRSKTFVSIGKDSRNADDGHGHGTHVAGIVAAVDNTVGVVGVAAGAAVVAVKVLNSQGSGTYSDVIAGVDYVAGNAALGDVANMSLGGPASDALDAAVLRAADKGIFITIAAGNSSDDANKYSPARVNHTYVFTVSAFDSTDTFASFSNYGNPPIDFSAPGVSILSLWKGGTTKVLSGTSMAAPHVGGILLLGVINIDGQVIGDVDGVPDPIAHR